MQVIKSKRIRNTPKPPKTPEAEINYIKFTNPKKKK